MSTIVTRAGKGSPLTNTELDSNFTNLNTDKLEINAALGTPASVTLTNATGLPTAGLVDNAVTDAKLRDSAGLSVIGRGANSTGNPADISAGANHQVLRRDGSSLGFGAVDLSSNQAVTGTLPVNQGGTGITSFGSGVATWLGTPSSANLAAAVTDETGTGALVFANSPTLVTPALGTPASGVVTNLTGTASININGTVGATTPAAGAFTTLSASSTLSVTGAGSIQGLTVGRGAGNIDTNTAVGASALANNTTGFLNTATGFCALQANTTGDRNTAHGRTALRDNTTGARNTATGMDALFTNTTGNFNTATGFDALLLNTTGGCNTATGANALLLNTTGCNNTASGLNALCANTTASGNVAMGFEALCANTTGCENVAVGFTALKSNTTGLRNTATGFCALQANTTGCNNTAHGRMALRDNTTGNDNTATGLNALVCNTTGVSNTASGVSALFSNTTGCNNIGIGLNAGRTGGTPAGIVNITTESNRIVMGNDDHTCAQIKIAWTATSDCRDKLCFAPIALGLDFVRALKPTEYQFKTGGRDSIYTDGKRRYGFLAQDVLPLEGENPVIISADDPDKLQYTESHLIPVLVKAIQELTLKNEALEARLEALENA